MNKSYVFIVMIFLLSVHELGALDFAEQEKTATRPVISGQFTLNQVKNRNMSEPMNSKKKFLFSEKAVESELEFKGEKKHYFILGLLDKRETATWAEIQTAYNQKMQEAQGNQQLIADLNKAYEYFSTLKDLGMIPLHQVQEGAVSAISQSVVTQKKKINENEDVGGDLVIVETKPIWEQENPEKTDYIAVAAVLKAAADKARFTAQDSLKQTQKKVTNAAQESLDKASDKMQKSMDDAVDRIQKGIEQKIEQKANDWMARFYEWIRW